MDFRTGEAEPSPHGDIRSFDMHTGEMKWAFHAIPHPNESGFETWPKTRGSTPARRTTDLVWRWMRSVESSSFPPVRLSFIISAKFICPERGPFSDDVIRRGRRTASKLYVGTVESAPVTLHTPSMRADNWRQVLAIPAAMLLIMLLAVTFGFVVGVHRLVVLFPNKSAFQIISAILFAFS
jgi:hypothetical protein